MRVLCRVLLIVLAVSCLLTAFTFGESDQAAAERILGPNWQRMSRRAGMIFAGTILNDAIRTAPRQDRPIPSVELHIAVDRSIAGVDSGGVMTIDEWSGAWSSQRPMRRGQHFLFFLYAPSRLGLTSTVGGIQGRIELDARGTITTASIVDFVASQANERGIPAPRQRKANLPVSILQLERAIRAARGE
jgi:hypothetical protein